MPLVYGMEVHSMVLDGFERLWCFRARERGHEGSFSEQNGLKMRREM